jgi:ATP-dependent Lhr-like helicase
VHASALLRLAQAGWVEDVKPVRRAWHILAHQVLALTLQQGGVSRHRVMSWVGQATPFADLTEKECHELTDTMVERGILDESDGLLSLGLKGEKIYGRRNFFELYAVFSSPPLFKVLRGRNEIGTVDSLFVSGHDHDAGPMVFRLAGKAWMVVRQDLKRGKLYVEPAEGGKIPTWLGQGGMLSYELCQEMKRTLREAGPEVGWLGPRASEELAALRFEYDGLVEDGRAPLEMHGTRLNWHTFAGGNINRMLAAAMAHAGTGKWVVGNRLLRLEKGSVSAAQAAIRSFETMDFREIAAALGDRWKRGQLSKFDRCLPDHAVEELMLERLLDPEGARAFLKSHTFPVVLG